MLDYKIMGHGTEYHVWYFRRGHGWQVLKRQPKHYTYLKAYDWLVENKLDGNYANARLHVYHS